MTWWRPWAWWRKPHNGTAADAAAAQAQQKLDEARTAQIRARTAQASFEAAVAAALRRRHG